MALKTKVLNKYNLPYFVHGCISLPNEICVVLGSHAHCSGRFLILKSGHFEVLDYEIPRMKFDHFNYRGALYKTDSGFGCVLDHSVIEYDFNNKIFKKYPFKSPFPEDNQHETGPLKTAIKIADNELLFPLEDYFYKFKSSYFAKVYLHDNYATHDPFIYSMKKSQSSHISDCSVAYVNNTILFHRCEYFKMHMDNPSDRSELCSLINGNENIISEVSKGVSQFSTDCAHLLVKTHSAPFKLEFYSITGEKESEIALTPKKVIGDLNKRYLSIFDKFNDRLWMARDTEVTETLLA
ncbi:hypothetical protein [Thalassotalea sp. PP2-459]|uniref:hypothetical protein n=2 Tax=Pseudomonadota TaxID=1224 RepID=UPI00111512B9|nr:hypothetical protein [Thalassotalea sp. PP2-459]